MRTLPFSVSLNGRPPMIPGLLTEDVTELPPVRSVAALPLAGGLGSAVGSVQRQALRVRVDFRLPEADYTRRAAAADALRAWAAGGGDLRLGCRPGKKLRVRCETLPALGSCRDWAAPLPVVFAAYERPFWEAEQPLTVHAGTGLSVSAPLSPAGTAPRCLLCVKAVNAGTAALTCISITCAETAELIRLEGLGVPPGDAVELTESETGRLLLRRTGSLERSLLPARTPDSSDAVTLLQRRSNHVTVAADQAVTVTLQAFGRDG